jgi:PHD/YefM family antitoxin component YafN of YafNO toxin-antitoxin module
MRSVTSTFARQNWAEVIEMAKREPIQITDHGRPSVVLMHPKLAKVALGALDEAYDLKEVEKVLKSRKKDGKTYSLEEVAAELGIELD